MQAKNKTNLHIRVYDMRIPGSSLCTGISDDDGGCGWMIIDGRNVMEPNYQKPGTKSCVNIVAPTLFFISSSSFFMKFREVRLE